MLIGFAAVIEETEKVTEIRAVLIQYSFCLCFVAVVINAGIVISAVKATMQVGFAIQTLLLPADKFFEFNFFLALVTNCHIDRHIDVTANSQG